MSFTRRGLPRRGRHKSYNLRSSLRKTCCDMADGLAVIDAAGASNPMLTAMLTAGFTAFQASLVDLGIPVEFTESLRDYNRGRRTMASLMEELEMHARAVVRRDTIFR